ncbi:hypothetical protein D3C78_887770 [compost metagenome]
MNGSYFIACYSLYDLLRVLFPSRLKEYDLGSLNGPPELLPDRYIEGIRCFLQNNIRFSNRVLLLHPMETVH